MKGATFVIDTECDNYKNGFRSKFDISKFTVLEVQQKSFVGKRLVPDHTREILPATTESIVYYQWLIAAWVDDELVFVELDQEEFMQENGYGLWKLDCTGIAPELHNNCTQKGAAT